MIGSVEYLKKASQRTGYTRERYADSLANSESNVLVFFGDERARFILSSLILPDMKDSWIVCSKPLEDFFHTANEYWSGGGMQEASDFSSPTAISQVRLFERYFQKVEDADKFKDKNISDFKECHLPKVDKFFRFLPEGRKVFIRTGKTMLLWVKNKEVKISIPQSFWETVCEKLVSNNIIPICHRTEDDYDMSPLVKGCHHFYDLRGPEVLSLMRACGMVLDFSQNVCYTSMQARCPCVCMQDRQRYYVRKLNDLEGLGEMHTFFSFPNLIEHGKWEYPIQGVVNKLKSLNWSGLSPCEGLVVSLGVSSDKKLKKTITKLIKVKK
jgi:hypothetical protein